MATFRKSVQIVATDAIVFPDLVANQITAGTAPSVGNLIAYVHDCDNAADNGVYCHVNIPKNYVGTPKIIVKGILDGAPGATNTLGFALRKRAVANDESADGTFDAEEGATAAIIGSSGLNYSDEDLLDMALALTAGDFAVDDLVYFFVYTNVSANSYAGNFLLQSVEFEWTDT